MFIQKVLGKCFSRSFVSSKAISPRYNFHNLAFSLKKAPKVIDDKIEDNITQKINSMQFKSLKEDIFNSGESNNYHNTDVLRLITLKSIQKKNSNFAYEVFEDMTALDIVPDDVTYTALMETLLYEGDTEDAFQLYIQAYLNNIILDLEIFQSLFERLEKKDLSYMQIAYNILKTNLIPSKYLYDHLIHYAQKSKDSDFTAKLYEDMNKIGIKKVDKPRRHRDSRNYPVKKTKSSTAKSGRKKNKYSVAVIPFDTLNGRSLQGGLKKGEDSWSSILDDLVVAINQNKGRDKDLYLDSEDEFGSDGSVLGHSSDDSDNSDLGSSDYSSESDSD